LVRRRPQELVDRYVQVIEHIVANYRPEWDSWARPDLDHHLPPVTVDEQAHEDEEDEGRFSSERTSDKDIPPMSATPSMLGSDVGSPEPLPVSKASRKRSAVVSSPPSPDSILKLPPRKRSRPQLAKTLDSSLAIPTPFPSSISISQFKQIKNLKQETKWIDAAKQAGLMKFIVCPPPPFTWSLLVFSYI
jgi:hypothetical protein